MAIPSQTTPSNMTPQPDNNKNAVVFAAIGAVILLAMLSLSTWATQSIILTKCGVIPFSMPEVVILYSTLLVHYHTFTRKK